MLMGLTLRQTPKWNIYNTYELCEVGASPSCDTATATVVVNNPIDAVNDPSVTRCLKQYGSNGIERIDK
jgi:hypothetical protein